VGARELYEEALGLAPDDPWIHGRFADFCRRAGDLEAAREHFERATAGEHPDREALLQYAEILAREGSLESAAALERRALRLRRGDPAALAMLAATKTLLGAPGHEVAMYRQALHMQPSHPVAALNRAQILLRRDGADEEARQLLVDLSREELSSEMRLELLFYVLTYSFTGFEGADREIRALLEAGVVMPAWDISLEAAAARERGHPHAELLAQVARRPA
jgi:tetratricopeptide (TPR) repeat protein